MNFSCHNTGTYLEVTLGNKNLVGLEGLALGWPWLAMSGLGHNQRANCRRKGTGRANVHPDLGSWGGADLTSPHPSSKTLMKGLNPPPTTEAQVLQTPVLEKSIVITTVEPQVTLDMAGRKNNFC